MYKQLCDEIGDLVARHLGGEDVEADLAAWSRRLGEARWCAIPEDEEDTMSCESAQRLRAVAAALGWTAPSSDGFWHHEALGPVHDDDLMPFLLDQLRGSDRVKTLPDAAAPHQSPSLVAMQGIWLEIIRRWWHNGITGEKVVADLLAHREWWASVIVDRRGEDDGLIRLRDLPDDHWNADTLYILVSDGKYRRNLMHLAAGWNPGNVVAIDDPRSMDNTRGKPVVAVWWD